MPCRICLKPFTPPNQDAVWVSGLAIVKHYVTADFGGTIDASTSDCTGTCFTVKLPPMLICLKAPSLERQHLSEIFTSLTISVAIISD
jgi:hypothetical protein